MADNADLGLSVAAIGATLALWEALAEQGMIRPQDVQKLEQAMQQGFAAMPAHLNELIQSRFLPHLGAIHAAALRHSPAAND